eukprot:GCRY01008449.1.p1 GENE.GCRY01008449.1~~GCRY01008449.1.p1  ORF type:complete len:184 (-),score=19.95 GCRY01008449.1:305-856(-)
MKHKRKNYFGNSLQQQRSTHFNLQNHVQNKVLTLQDCLEAFATPEVLDEDNMWYCTNCKDFRCASKNMSLYSVPKVLIIHLKRFERKNTKLIKDNTPVQIDMKLDLSPYLEHEGPRPVYDLFAMSLHSGNLGGGHYTAAARNFVDSKWYYYNDTNVKKMTQTELLLKTQDAYILFYIRGDVES